MKYLSVYISFPFCRQKCHFCDWVQRIPKQDLLRAHEDGVRKQYLAALCAEITTLGPQLSKQGYMPKVIYWGGGTSTSMTQSEVNQIWEALNQVFDLSEVTECTIEGSPDTVTLDSLSYYRSLGFNRFSVGIQSFNDQRLKHLGRRHDRESSIEIVHTAKKAGFKQISIDLMCGFPDETVDEIEDNVAVVKDLDIKQLSLYTFRPTQGTILRRNIEKYSTDLEPAKQVKAYKKGSMLLQKLGFQEYGVGYYGDVAENVVGMFCLQYDVVGFGSGALSILDGEYRNHTSGLLHEYIKNPLEHAVKMPIASSVSAMFTLLRSGLSIYNGINLQDWHERLKKTVHECLEQPEMLKITELFKQVGGLTIDDERIYLTKDKAPLVLIGVVNGSMMSN